MSSTSAVGVTTRHTTLPFITTAWFRAQPTGIAADAMMPGVTDERKQDDELARFIEIASQEMNTFCYGSTGGVLHATTDTETVMTRLNRLGQFKLAPRFLPVRQLTAFSFGPDPTLMTSLADFSAVHVEEDKLIVPAFPFTGMSSSGPLQFGPIIGADWLARVVYSYVNGFPLNYCQTALSAGNTSMSVLDATGMFVGDSLRFRDTVNGDDTVTITSVSGTTVGFSACANPHPVGTQVDGLPDDIMQACVEITKGMIKRKAQDSIKPSGRGGAARGGEEVAAGEDNFAVGYGKLMPYQMVRFR